MNAARLAALLALGIGATAALPSPTTETEPNGFTTPAPQPLGALGAGGLSVSGALDPTSPTGLSPGDDDGFSFVPDADGPFRAVVDDGAGATFVLGLSEQTEAGTFLRAAVIGAAPLTLSRPALVAGRTYRVGVAALGDGTPLPYTLALDPVNAVPPWTGAPCPGPTPEAEPNDDIVHAVDLGWFDRILCAEGELSSVAPVESEVQGDADWFRFRNVLPVTATLKVTADPGVLDVEVARLLFVGPGTVASDTFGDGTELDLPVLEPGADFLVRISGRSGAPPVRYSFFLEPVGPKPEEPPEPMFLEKSILKMPPVTKRSRFTVRGAFEPGLGSLLKANTSVTLKLRGGEAALASGSLVLDDLGRLVWKAPPGLTGIRRLLFDPYEGILRIDGKGVDLAGSVDPLDPSIFFEIEFGNLRIGTTGEGAFSKNGRVLRVK